MMKITLAFCGLCGGLLSGTIAAAAQPCDDRAKFYGIKPIVACENAAALPKTQDSLPAGELALDPVAFFQKLVDRYRGLHLYKDVVSVVQVTQREGEECKRVETKIACEVADGKLRVQTPASQLRQGLGLDVPLKQSQPMKEAQTKYDLWLAPHMALKFTEQPLKEMRAGVEEGFTATEAEPVTIDNKKMVHVELRSGDGVSEHCNAKLDLYVNSDSMLIERIESEQRMPDGANYSTTLDIVTEEAEGETPSAAPAQLPATEQMLQPAT